jgi:phage/plasmid-associated DNA primase
MSLADEFIKKISKNRVNNPVFSCFNYSNKKKIPVDSSNVVNFYKDYCDLIDEHQDDIFLLGEVSGETIPIISEFIFKFERIDDEEEDFYDYKLVHGLIICHHKVISKLISTSSRNAEFLSLVTESKNWKDGGTTCVKVNIKFPYTCLGKEFLKNVFRKELLTEIRKAKLEQYFTISSPLGDWSAHLKEIKDVYPLYGSSESSKIPPALFTGVYKEYKDGICKRTTLEKAYAYEKHQFFKNGKCNLDDLDILDTIEEGKDLNTVLLPIFNSIYFYSSISRIKNVDEDMDTSSSYSNDSSERNDSINEKTDLDICLDLIDLLSKERFENEENFLDIGSALYNATWGSEEGFKIWLGLKKQIDEEDYDEYEDIYESFDTRNITLKTLGWYARKDNPEKYKEWHKDWCYPKLTESIRDGGTQVSLGEAFYRVFWLDYMFSRNRWYVFRDHTLSGLNEIIPLRINITNGLIPFYLNFESQLTEKKNKKGEQNIKSLEITIKQIRKIIKDLKTESCRNQIINSSQTYFWKENINKILNKNPYTLGAKNCVIEVNDKKAFARPGKPEDYITKNIGVRYKYKYNYSHKDVKDLLLYLRQVFPNNSVNHHMKKDISSFLFRRNAEKKLRVWIGDTNGSKSIYQKMIRKMLGQYYCDLPAEYYSSQQKSGSGPNPELAQSEDTNVGFSSELDTDISIKGPRVKKITGGDSFFARNCNQDGGSIETTFKPVLVLNMVPDIDGNDEANHTRFSMVPYEGRWLRPEELEKYNKEFGKFPEDIEEQIKIKTFIMDGNFEKNIPRLASALLWLAVDFYKTYKKEGLSDPPYMQKWMANYWKKNDSLTSFIYERLENPKIIKECCTDETCQKCEGKNRYETIDETKTLTATELYPEFRRWFYETYPNKKKDQMPDKKKFTAIMSNQDKLGPQISRKWHGIALRIVNNLD